MIPTYLNNFKIPALPTLKNGFVVVQEAAWKELTQYVQMQTDVINSLIAALENLNNIQKLTSDKHNEEYKLLQTELGEIAKALEGEFVDE